MRMLEEAVYLCVCCSTQTWCLYPSCWISSIAVFGNKATPSCVPTSLIWDYMMMGSMGGYTYLVLVSGHYPDFLDGLWPDDSARWNVTGSLIINKNLLKNSNIWHGLISTCWCCSRTIIETDKSSFRNVTAYGMSRLQGKDWKTTPTGEVVPSKDMWKKTMRCLN